jgi:hypothetical protein
MTTKVNPGPENGKVIHETVIAFERVGNRTRLRRWPPSHPHIYVPPLAVCEKYLPDSIYDSVLITDEETLAVSAIANCRVPAFALGGWPEATLEDRDAKLAMIAEHFDLSEAHVRVGFSKLGYVDEKPTLHALPSAFEFADRLRTEIGAASVEVLAPIRWMVFIEEVKRRSLLGLPTARRSDVVG